MRDPRRRRWSLTFLAVAVVLCALAAFAGWQARQSLGDAQRGHDEATAAHATAAANVDELQHSDDTASAKLRADRRAADVVAQRADDVRAAALRVSTLQRRTSDLAVTAAHAVQRGDRDAYASATQQRNAFAAQVAAATDAYSSALTAYQAALTSSAIAQP